VLTFGAQALLDCSCYVGALGQAAQLTVCVERGCVRGQCDLPPALSRCTQHFCAWCGLPTWLHDAVIATVDITGASMAGVRHVWAPAARQPAAEFAGDVIACSADVRTPDAVLLLGTFGTGGICW
jgi:hypothetical protein